MNLLTVTGLSKSFGGLRAVDDVGFAVKGGAIKAVIGPNGAGKTTLFNLVFGAIVPDQGSVEFAGARLPAGRPHRSVSAGMARTFQHIRLFPQMSALENVMVGAHLRLDRNPLKAMLRWPAMWAADQPAATTGWIWASPTPNTNPSTGMLRSTSWHPSHPTLLRCCHDQHLASPSRYSHPVKTVWPASKARPGAKFPAG